MTVRMPECISPCNFRDSGADGNIEFETRVTLAEVSRHVAVVNTLSSWIYPGYPSSLAAVCDMNIYTRHRERAIVAHEHFILPLAEAALSHYFIIRICNSNEASADENCLTEKFVRLASIDKRILLCIRTRITQTGQTKIKTPYFRN